jgi:hypothetical protein
VTEPKLSCGEPATTPPTHRNRPTTPTTGPAPPSAPATSCGARARTAST